MRKRLLILLMCFTLLAGGLFALHASGDVSRNGTVTITREEYDQLLKYQKLEEVLQALSISAATNPIAEFALSQLPKLRGCDIHFSDIITQDDASTFRKLGVNFTCEPEFPTKSLYFR